MTATNNQNMKLPKRFEKGIDGTARDVEKREVPSKVPNKQSDEYLSFRLERVDDQGNVLEIIPVEIRAENIPGRIIKEGDSVIIIGHRNRQGLMIPKYTYNATTNSEIIIRGVTFGGALLGGFLGIIVTFSAIGFLAGIILSFAEPETGIPILIISTFLLVICSYIATKQRL